MSKLREYEEKPDISKFKKLNEELLKDIEVEEECIGHIETTIGKDARFICGKCQGIGKIRRPARLEDVDGAITPSGGRLMVKKEEIDMEKPTQQSEVDTSELLCSKSQVHFIAKGIAQIARMQTKDMEYIHWEPIAIELAKYDIYYRKT